jgi:hypothetical protein
MSSANSPEPAAADQQYQRRLAHDYFVRIHMSLILVAVTFSGVLTSKVLLELGVRSLRLRFPLAVLASYGVFLLLVRIWIWYVSFRQDKQAARAAPDGRSRLDAGAGFALGLGAGKRRSTRGGVSFDLGSGGGGGVGGGSSGFSGFGGGSSGGGGATSSWDANVGEAVPQHAFMPVPAGSDSISSAGASAHSSGSWFPKLNFDFDFDGDGWIILVLLAALILAIVGAGGYLIYAAPHILSDAAWQALLATTLTRVSKTEHHNWMAGVLRSTCIPFAIVLLFASALGWEAHRYCPDAPRLIDVILKCVMS